MKLKFSICGWSAWSPERTRLSDWQAWAIGQQVSAQPGLPDVDNVPVMQRRRMSSLSKMAVATAYNISKYQAVRPCCIFASRHGELDRTMKIMENIVKGEDISPTDFSLSVHSTALGLFSIFTENKEPSTMVGGGEDTFGSALIEATVYLKRYPETPVLVVFFDEPLPGPLKELERPAGESFSIALLLSAVTEPNVEICCESNAGGISEGRNPGMAFLKFYLSGARQGTVNTRRSQWRWSLL